MNFFPFWGMKIGDLFFTKRNIVATYSLFNSIFRIWRNFAPTEKRCSQP